MAVKCGTVLQHLETLAPRRLAENWDNVGLLVGDPGAEVQGVLVTLDITAAVVQEALTRGANLIVSHHPLIFKPLHRIATESAAGALVARIIKNELNIYCAHTNLDVATGGVSDVLARLLKLENVKVLSATSEEKLYKLVVFVPEGFEDQVRESLAAAGAGWIGNYSHCTYQVGGTGTFLPLEGTNPFVGQQGKLEKVAELRLETIVTQSKLSGTVRAMTKAHPYEEVAFDIYPLANQGEQVGLGRIGDLPEEINLGEFVRVVHDGLNAAVRVAGNTDQLIRRVAVCGGSGGKFVDSAFFGGAQVLLTGDVDYHQAQRALDLGLAVIDAGHGETEQPMVEVLVDYLKNRLEANKQAVPVYSSQTITNPWR